MKTTHWIIIIWMFILSLYVIQSQNKWEVKNVYFPLKSQIGYASYYDYILDSGWSSLGHKVCATRDYKRYSYIKVTNLANNKSVVCRVTDYGPDKSIYPERIIDLSSYSFSQIADLKLGVIKIKIERQ